MKGTVILFVLLVAPLALASEWININNGVDQMINIANEFLAKETIEPYQLEPLTFEDVQLLNGTMVGASTLTRTGDALSESDADHLTLDLHLGLRRLEVTFGQMVLGGERMSGVLRLLENSLHVNLTFTKRDEGGCGALLNSLELERLRATLEASVEKYNGLDVSPYLLRLFHDQLAGHKHSLEEAIALYFCPL